MLDNYKWYRKLRGGIWYKLYYKKMESIDRIFWSKTHNGHNILEMEIYK